MINVENNNQGFDPRQNLKIKISSLILSVKPHVGAGLVPTLNVG